MMSESDLVVIEQGHLEAQAAWQLMLAVSSDAMIQKTPHPPPPPPSTPSTHPLHPPQPFPPAPTVPSTYSIHLHPPPLSPPPTPTVPPPAPPTSTPFTRPHCPLLHCQPTSSSSTALSCLSYLCHCQSHSPCCHSNHFFHPPTHTHTHTRGCVCVLVSPPIRGHFQSDLFCLIFFQHISHYCCCCCCLLLFHHCFIIFCAAAQTGRANVRIDTSRE